MTKEEKIKLNIGLTFDLLREIIKNPSLGEQIPNGATVIFLDKELTLPEKKINGKNNKFIKIKRKFEIV